jgi:hypothetical protein
MELNMSTITTKTLHVGRVYAIHHRRKGHFKALLEAVIPAETGDEKDTQLLTVRIDTRRGSGQERLARANSPVTVTNIRPSLVIAMVELDESWQVMPRPKPAEISTPVESEKSWIEKLLDKIDVKKTR